MTVTIYPGRAAGTAAAPPSKSCAHRMLLCGALAEGESVIEGIAPSQDMLATVDCIRTMGGACRLEGDTACITGTGGHIRPGGMYPCRESGSTLRFCIPPALLSGGSAVFTGTPRLMERGVGIYEELLTQKGISVSAAPDAVTFSGRLTPGDYTLRGDVSSQFVTGLLLALPLLPDSSTLRVLPPVESRPYIDITLDIMAAFGVRVEADIRRDLFPCFSVLFYQIYCSAFTACFNSSVRSVFSQATERSSRPICPYAANWR